MVWSELWCRADRREVACTISLRSRLTSSASSLVRIGLSA